DMHCRRPARESCDLPWSPSFKIRSALGPLGAVLGTRVATLGHARAIQTAAHRVITHTRQILDTATANQHHRVLLQIVAFTADIAYDLETVGQANFGNLAQCRVRLLRSGGVNAGADTPTLRAALQGRRAALVRLGAASLANQLVGSRHGLDPQKQKGRPDESGLPRSGNLTCSATVWQRRNAFLHSNTRSFPAPHFVSWEPASGLFAVF